MHRESVKIGGRKVPRGTERWSLFAADGRRCMWKGDDGVEVGDFPIAELSAEAILTRWGAGAYRLQFLGERAGRQKALGNRVIIVAPPDVTAPAPVASAPPSPAASTDPLVHAFQIVDAIDRRAAAAAERDRVFLQTCLGMAMQRQESEESRGIAALTRTVQAMQAQLAASQLAASQRDDDDEEEEEEDEEEENDEQSGALFRPGEPVRDTVVAETMNGIASVLKDLAPAARQLIEAKVLAMAAEIQKETNGAAAVAPTS